MWIAPSSQLGERVKKIRTKPAPGFGSVSCSVPLATSWAAGPCRMYQNHQQPTAMEPDATTDTSETTSHIIFSFNNIHHQTNAGYTAADCSDCSHMNIYSSQWPQTQVPLSFPSYRGKTVNQRSWEKFKAMTPKSEAWASVLMITGLQIFVCSKI